MKYIKLFLLLLIVGFVFSISDVYAYVRVGNQKINDGEVKIMYGGSAAYINGELVLNGVSINNIEKNSSNEYTSIYSTDGELNIKLMGNNVIDAICTGPDCDKYRGIYSEQSGINIYGDGILWFNVSGFGPNTHLILDDSVTIGTESDFGPTFMIYISDNTNLMGGGISTINNMYNSNVFTIVEDSTSFVGYRFESNCKVLNSNISFRGAAHQELKAYVFNGDALINNSNLLSKAALNDDNKSKEEKIKGFSSSVSSNITLGDSRVAILSPIASDNNINFTLKRTGEAYIDYYFEGKVNGTISFNNITDDMKYTSTTTKEALSTTPKYNPSLLSTYKYINITNIPTYFLVQGWMPIYPYSPYSPYNPWKLKTSGNMFFMNAIKIDGVEFDSNDYTYTDDGEITFTDSGADKLEALSDGTHTLEIDFYNNKKIVYDFEMSNGSIVNPETIDKIINYVVALIISIIGIVAIIILKKKMKKKNI